MHQMRQSLLEWERGCHHCLLPERRRRDIHHFAQRPKVILALLCSACRATIRYEFDLLSVNQCACNESDGGFGNPDRAGHQGRILACAPVWVDSDAQDR
jgi:hypothetical protein